MKIYFLPMIAATLMTGCAAVTSVSVPSFWDDNQSRVAADIRLAVDQIDCAKPQLSQVVTIDNHIRWFQLYSESKGSRQKDVLRVIDPMHRTIKEWKTRVETGSDASAAYCEIKKRVLTAQGRLAAEAILGRY